MHGIDPHFALRISLQRKPDGHVLRRLHEQRSLGLFAGKIGSQTLQQLLQIQFGIGIGLAEFLLQDRSLRFVFSRLSKPGKQPNRLNDLLLLEPHNAPHDTSDNAATASPSCCSPASAPAHQRNAA